MRQPAFEGQPLQTKGALKRRLQVSGTKSLHTLLQLTFLQEAHLPLQREALGQTLCKEQSFLWMQRLMGPLMPKSL